MKIAAAAIVELAAQAAGTASRRELSFHIVNRTVVAVPYDRASLWDTGGGMKALAASGGGAPDPKSPYVLAWRAALRTLDNRDSPADLPAGLPERLRREVAAGTPKLSALWLPLPKTGVGLLVERFEAGFADDEKMALRSLADLYAMAWLSRGKREARGRTPRRLGALVALAVLAAALAFIRLPLRVVAPCEVVPVDPVLVAAPLDGVIREIMVGAGEMAYAGHTVLAEYESGVALEELEVARRQVGVVEAELRATRARAFDEARQRSEAQLLEARLEQEKARLGAAEARARHLVVHAPRDGVVRMEDPKSWRGRPVTVGERLLWLVDPAVNRVRIWLPQSDRVDFDFKRPVRVHLSSLGGELREARLTHVSTLLQPTPLLGYAFPADAEWLEASGDEARLLGLTGSAVLYGPEVSLGYWLFRTPVAGVRRWLGL